MLLHSDIIDGNARQHGAREAFSDRQGRRVTWAQYADRARRIGSSLYRLGLRRQDRFAVLGMNSLEYYQLYGTADLTGFIPVPLNFRLAPPELLEILRDSAPKALFFDARHASVVADLRDRNRDIAQFVCIDGHPGDRLAGALALDDLVHGGSPDGAPLRPHPEDYATLFYTSGTTGRAKGVLHDHRATARNTAAIANVSEITGASVVLQTSPAFHVGGRCYVSAALWNAGRIVVHQAFDPAAVVDAIERERVTFTFMVAAMLQAVLDLPDIGKRDLSSLSNVVSAAAPIPVPLLKRAMALLGPVFSLQYGSTETGSATRLPRHALKTEGTPAELRLLGSIGHPAPGVSVRIVRDDGSDVDVGEVGELVLRTDGMFSGYWNNHVATLEVMRDGWYHSGDMGVYDENAYITLVDRKKDMIITGGENVYSREVEEAIHQHPDVVESAVIGVPHPKWVETVMAVVVARAGARIDPQALIEFTRTRIAGYKCPTVVEFATELPRLASGKIDKVALRRTRVPAAPAGSGT
ncbi:MAG: class I adenylate-forming enzyme family protein [Gammaproteobacteria bacterium]